ncbi:MAG: hypothetical protein Q8S84_00440 [bacterium]|nr:hypothetical protein [bacterium]MDP3380057.1 hypothetical protein [bacterium]
MFLFCISIFISFNASCFNFHSSIFFALLISSFDSIFCTLSSHHFIS